MKQQEEPNAANDARGPASDSTSNDRAVKLNGSALRSFVQMVFFALAIKPFMALFIGLRVRGREHLTGPGPFILIANHSSHLDTMSLLCLFPLRKLRGIRQQIRAAQELTG